MTARILKFSRRPPTDDRAVVIADSILRTVKRALLSWLQFGFADFQATRAEIEELLRNEFRACADGGRHD